MLTAAARRWVEDVTGTPLTGAQPMPGATSSDVFGLTFVDGRELVLRLHTKAEWLAAEPDIAAREAIALQALNGSDVVAPSLVAVDVDGGICGRPAVLMTRLRGRAELTDASPARLRALAAALRPLHRMSAPPELPLYRRYVSPEERAIPVWTTSPDTWRAAFDICDVAAPAGASALIHRDYHPGNVLIDGGVVSGIVDWPNACAGPPEIDVAHCRVNLAMTHGLAAADAFAAEAATDSQRQAFWDVVDCVDLLDDPLEAVGDLVHGRLDDYLVDAVRRVTSAA